MDYIYIGTIDIVMSRASSGGRPNDVRVIGISLLGLEIPRCWRSVAHPGQGCLPPCAELVVETQGPQIRPPHTDGVPCESLDGSSKT